MAQKKVWEKEYSDPKLIALGDVPRKDLKVFLKFLRRTEDVSLENLRVLDLGSGTGSNGNYIASLGNEVVGLDISEKAVKIAQERATAEKVTAEYRTFDIGTRYPFADHSYDLVIDVMSSNSLDEEGRRSYLGEAARVLKPGGYFFVRALCKDGDTNAKNLLKKSPGREHDTYIMPKLGLTERVFSEVDFRELYGEYFALLKLQKKANYARFTNMSYKRQYWVAYMQRPL